MAVNSKLTRKQPQHAHMDHLKNREDDFFWVRTKPWLLKGVKIGVQKAKKKVGEAKKKNNNALYT